jgi:predicted Zn finger-like uncharacterized protein
MPEIISCPNCSRKLRVPDDMLGRQVKCPGCSKIFVAAADTGEAVQAEPSRRPQPPSRPRDEDEEDRPRRRSPRDEEEYEEDDRPRRRRMEDEDEEDRPRLSQEESEGWGRVRGGLGMVATSFFILIGTTIFTCVGAVIGLMMLGISVAKMSESEVATSLGGLTFVVIIFLLGMVATSVFQLLGYGMCLSVPPRAGAKPFALASLGLGLLGVALVLTGIGVQVFLLHAVITGNSAAAQTAFLLGNFHGWGLVNLVGWLCFWGGLTTFAFFLRSAVIAVRKPGMAVSMLVLGIVGGAIVLGLFTGALLQHLALSQGINTVTTGNPATAPNAIRETNTLASMGNLCGCTNAILLLGWIIWYIISVFQVRGVVDRYIRGR